MTGCAGSDLCRLCGGRYCQVKHNDHWFVVGVMMRAIDRAGLVRAYDGAGDRVRVTGEHKTFDDGSTRYRLDIRDDVRLDLVPRLVALAPALSGDLLADVTIDDQGPIGFYVTVKRGAP